jgi:hypothetical protein
MVAVTDFNSRMNTSVATEELSDGDSIVAMIDRVSALLWK